MDACWVLELVVDRAITLPCGTAVDRETFCDWLWAHDGDAMLGIDHGAIDVDEAAALGLIPTTLLLDAAAAPADRDWPAAMPAQRMTIWFTTAAAARAAGDRLAGSHGCRIGAMHPTTISGAATWRDTFGPISVPGFGTIHPAWAVGHAMAAPQGTVMFIEPGVGFGTGLHPTTQLCLQSLAAWTAGRGPLGRVLDFGSGSGILGIAAALHGAARVDAIENDGTVHGAIRMNAARNGVGERIDVAAALPPPGEPHDLVIANIVAPVLQDHARALCDRLRPEASGLILGGLLEDQVPAVVAAFAAASVAGWATPRVTASAAWRCVSLVRAARP